MSVFAEQMNKQVCRPEEVTPVLRPENRGQIYNSELYINICFDWPRKSIDRRMLLLFKVKSKWWLSVRMLWLKEQKAHPTQTI